MRPVHKFKANFNQIEGFVSEKLNTSADCLILHDDASSVRNLCLIWPDGRRAFLNYAYLVAGEFELNDERNTIKLSFSSYDVVLRGYGLATLFSELLDHLPRMIIAVDARYALPEDRHKPVVVDMTIEKQKD